MKSETAIVARNYRIQEWTAQIQDCKNRPKDMQVSEWCALHGITKATYYYRVKQVRKSLLSQMHQSFVEIPSGALKEPSVNEASASVVLNNCRIELNDHASDAFLEKLLKALRHAE